MFPAKQINSGQEILADSAEEPHFLSVRRT